MLVFSFSKFKLPHYLNGLIPILSVFTASYLFEIFDKKQLKKAKVFLMIQIVVVFLSLVALALFVLLFYRFAFNGFIGCYADLYDITLAEYI